MKLLDAKSECQRWLDYLERQKEKSIAVQQIAGERMDGKLTHAEAKARLKRIDSSVTVYDGAKLADAVKFLMVYADKRQIGRYSKPHKRSCAYL